MTKLDPIIAVKDVEASAQWYHQIFGFRNAHGGKDFAVLLDEDDVVMLCLHQWGIDEHPSLSDQRIPAGNGFLLYFKTDNMPKMLNRVEQMHWPIEEALHQNPNSRRKEFSLKDPDGYFITVTTYHEYEG
ncbi:MAG TPA: VOC family protein [Chitinophagaceae bacterium]|nr:VOC family protein [Chitinophagaceae bacterium]